MPRLRYTYFSNLVARTYVLPIFYLSHIEYHLHERLNKVPLVPVKLIHLLLDLRLQWNPFNAPYIKLHPTTREAQEYYNAKAKYKTQPK